MTTRRAGWEPKGEEKSITELEYDAAKERLMFLIGPSPPIIRDKDFDPGGLPHKRVRLYEECIDVLFEHWRGAKGLKELASHFDESWWQGTDRNTAEGSE